MPVTFSTGSTATFPAAQFLARYVVADFDGDGDVDILYQTGGNGTAWQYGVSNGDGTYTIVSQASSPFAGLTLPDNTGTNYFAADFDGDGDVDLYSTVNSATGSYFRNNGNGTFTSTSTATFPAATFSARYAVGDFDADGDADILYQTGGNGTAWQYASSNGDGTFTIVSQASSPFAGLTLPDNTGTNYHVADFDGDGDEDVYVSVNGATGSYFSNNGNGAFTSLSTTTFPAPQFSARVSVGDFDSDGDADILYQTGGNGSAWQYARSNGDGTFTILSQASSPFAGVTLVDHMGTNYYVGDLDGDGDHDLYNTVNAAGGNVHYANGAPPQLSSSTPSDGGTGVAVGANIVLTFNESVSKGSGNIYLYRGDGVLIETISVNSAQVTGSGTTWTIDPSVTLSGLTNYYVLVDDGTWVDADGSIFFGIDDPTTLNFTTASANTAPTITNLNGDSASFTEGAAVRLDVGGNATVADSEQANFNGGTLTVSITANEVADQDVLSVANIGTGAGQISVSGANISYQGVQIGTFTGGTGGADLVITLDADATPAATQALVRALQYNNTSQAPDPASRTVTVVLTDGAGGTSTTQTLTVAVTGVNDAPTVINGSTVTLAAVNEDVVNPAGATVASLFGSHFSDVDADAFAGIMIGINNSNASQGNWQVFTGGVWTNLPTLSPTNTYLVSASDSLRFVPAADYNGTPGSIVVLLIDDSAGAVVTGTRLDSSLTGSGGSTAYSSSTMALQTSVTSVEDSAVAVDDADTVTESGTVSGTVLGNDSDVDGPALSVSEVNGSAGNVGVQITLASGALLTLNADGTYTYDPNGAFDYLSDSASGGNNIIEDDSFTYTLANGNTATVTISVTGEDSEGDVVEGDGGPNILDGGAGDDTLRGGGGNDTLQGGSGSDTGDYSGAGAGVYVRLNAGDAPNDGDGGTDTLIGIENITGSAFNDAIVGDNGANVLDGGAGYDQLVGGGGSDTLIGGAGAANQLQGGLGDDVYIVEANDTVIELAGQGTDEVRTNRGALTLSANVEILTYTGAGAFTGTGNILGNTLTGGAGDDVLAGRGGNDILQGGGGSDTADYYAAAAGVTADVATGATDDGDGGADTFQSIENLRGSAFGDVLYGDGGANVLDGSQGDDVLVGRGGADTLRGGAGVDTADYSDASATVSVRLNMGTAADGEGGTDTLVSIENVVGGSGDDVLVGSMAANTLTGGAGRDSLIGNEGNDTLAGGAGVANELFGGLGDDTFIVDALDTVLELAGQGTDRVETSLNNFTLSANVENLAFTGTGNFAGTGNLLANEITGGAGSDTLTGGGGNDTLTGGLGYDTVVMSGASSEYVIEHLGGTQYRITDTVGGRDGVDVINGVEQVRFTNVTSVLNGGAGAPALADEKTGSLPLVRPPVGVDDQLTRTEDGPQVLPALGDDLFVDKDAFGPLVLPGVVDDAFLLTKTDDGPLVRPELFEDRLAHLSGVRDMGFNLFLTLDDNGLFVGHPLGDPSAGHDDWLL